MRAVIIALALCLSLVGGATGRSQPGEYVEDLDADDPFVLARLAPMSELGEGAIRFSNFTRHRRGETLYATGIVVEIGELRGATAEGRVLTFHQPSGGEWRVVRREVLTVSRRDYRSLVGTVDMAFHYSDTPLSSGEVHEVCVDGPGYLTERRQGGETRRLDGWCGAEKGNIAIAAELRRLLPPDRAALIPDV